MWVDVHSPQCLHSPTVRQVAGLGNWEIIYSLSLGLLFFDWDAKGSLMESRCVIYINRIINVPTDVYIVSGLGFGFIFGLLHRI